MSAAEPSPAVRLAGVSKTYRRGRREVMALDRVSLTVAPGEFVSIMGPSGSGKSTLLNLVAGLDVPDAGEVWVEDRSLAAASDDTLTDLRRTRVGVIFQFFNLLPSISALENVALPLRAAGVSRRGMVERAERALDLVGLRERRAHLPAELSGGEMQRVAIARALVIEPAIVLADEPTGNLDSATGDEILGTMRGLNRNRGVTVILVTHSPVAAAYGERVITLRDGTIVEETRSRPARTVPPLRPLGR